MRFVKKFTVNKPRNKLAQTCDPPRLYSQDKSFIQLVLKNKLKSKSNHYVVQSVRRYPSQVVNEKIYQYVMQSASNEVN